MSEPYPPSIVVEQVTKRFARSTARGDLRERFSRQMRGEKQVSGAFLALDSVSFTVQPGQPVGIIGHNGSGKSTLLKLLTGILKPTHGQVTVNGRVGALIEVGAGFHPDLSGRENVFLAGSILGLSRQQVRARYEQIVDFAGLADFMETPVKRYSSGMYMRLGFAIVAHLDPEILLVDEVLAVGDAFFQNKCLRFLKEFVKQGGTVAFVSHALESVQLLCETCVWLDKGQARFIGPTHEAIARYTAVVAEREDAEFARLYPVEWEAQRAEHHQREQEAQQEQARLQRLAEEAEQAAHESAAQAEVRRAQERVERVLWEAAPERLRVTALELLDSTKQSRTLFTVGEPFSLKLHYTLGRAVPSPVIGIDFFRISDSLHLFSTSNYDHQLLLPSPSSGIVQLSCPFLSLNAGHYRLRVTTYPDSSQPGWNTTPEQVIESALEFTVAHGPFANGCAYLPFQWEIEAL